MAFLTSRNASKDVLFALGVDPTARDADEGGSSNLASQTYQKSVDTEFDFPCTTVY